MSRCCEGRAATCCLDNCAEESGHAEALKVERDSLQVALLECGKGLVALEAERDKLAAQVLSLTLERDVARKAVEELETVCARLSAIPK